MPTTCSDVLLQAHSVEITAAGGAPPSQPKAAIVAYSGGLMRVPGWGLLAIDLNGLDLKASQVAILSDHDASLGGVLGQGSAQVVDGQLLVAGTISATTEAAKRVIELAKSGFAFQASVGIEPLKHETVPAGRKMTINGQTILSPEGGFTLISQSRLREVSVVVLGADPETTVRIAASAKECRMEKSSTQDEVQAAIKAERERVQEIEFLCSRDWKDTNKDEAKRVRAMGIAGEMEIGEVRARMRNLMRSEYPLPPVVGTQAPHHNEHMLTAALYHHLGLERIGAKYLDAHSMERGRSMRGSHMLDLCRAACEMEGIMPPSSRMELVMAGLSSVALPAALGDVVNKVLIDAYEESAPTWRSFCAVRSVSDFKTNTGIRPSLMGQLDQVPPGGELKHASMKEATYPFKIDTFGKMLTLDRRDLINDDLGVFLDTAKAMGQAARRKLSDLVYDTLLSAGTFFSAGNGNLLTGAESALTADGLSKAITLLGSQRNEQGDDLDIKPAVLVVPSELALTAQALLVSETLQRNVEQPTANVLRNIVGLQVEPRLSNLMKFGSKASKKHWYLFGASFTSPQLVAFLNGQENPPVEFFGLDTTPERLAVSWRVVFDFGTAMGDAKAAVRSRGE